MVSSLHGSRRTAHILFMKNEASGGLSKKNRKQIFLGDSWSQAGKCPGHQEGGAGVQDGSMKADFPSSLPARVGRRITKGKLHPECPCGDPGGNKVSWGSCRESLPERGNPRCAVSTDALQDGIPPKFSWESLIPASCTSFSFEFSG